MILTWVLAPILSMLTSILGVLPTVDMSWLPSVTVFAGLEGTANQWAPWFPWAFLSDMVLAGFVILAAFIVFEIAQWCYREIPDLWGFGPS